MRKLCPIIVILLSTMMPASGQDLPTNLHTTFMKPGVHLELGSVDGRGGFPVEAFEMLRLKAKGRSKPIDSLADLQGYVTIDSPQKALDYVRLLTSFSTWYLWHQDGLLEVTDRNRAKRMSDYGLDHLSPWEVGSGFWGVLSEKAAKRSGLSMAHVKPAQDGYTLTRWLFKHIETETEFVDTLLFVEEQVSRDGTYRRRILKQMPAPKLPETFWAVGQFL